METGFIRSPWKTEIKKVESLYIMSMKNMMTVKSYISQNLRLNLVMMSKILHTKPINSSINITLM